jgi:hypothetical protein
MEASSVLGISAVTGKGLWPIPGLPHPRVESAPAVPPGR